MKEGFTFPKKAAYFCLAAPFIAASIVFILNYSISDFATQQKTLYFFSITILSIGLVLGIYSLFYIHKIKDILIPASIGLAFNVLIAVFVYQSFINYKNDFIYYEIQSVMRNERIEYKQTILGRIHHTKQINYFVNTIKAGLLNACPRCTITDSQINIKMPHNFTGIFDNSRIKYTYVSIDTEKRDIGDIRFIFPELNPQPSCRDLVDYIRTQRRKFDRIGTVRCIESMNQ
jgi:hypothetical protein